MQQLAIVFWNPDQPTTRAAITLHTFDGDPVPAELTLSQGKDVCTFFKEYGIPLEQMMQMFPGTIVPYGGSRLFVKGLETSPGSIGLSTHTFTNPPDTVPLTWDSAWSWMTLPQDVKDLRRLAALLRMPISVFYYFDNQGDAVPVLSFRAEL